MAKSKYFPDLANNYDVADVEQIEQAFSDIEADITALESGKEDKGNRYTSSRGKYPSDLKDGDERYPSLYFLKLRDEEIGIELEGKEFSDNKIIDTDDSRPWELWNDSPFSDDEYFNANIVAEEFYKVHNEITGLQGDGGEYRLWDEDKAGLDFRLQKKQADGTWKDVEGSDNISFSNAFESINDLYGRCNSIEDTLTDRIESDYNSLTYQIEAVSAQINGNEGVIARLDALEQSITTVQTYTAASFESTAGSTVSLKPDTEIRITEAVTEISVALATDTSWTDIDNCGFCFISGDVPTTLAYSSTPIKWVGADCDSAGDFIPAKNTRYEVSVKYIMTTGEEAEDIVTARVGVF